MRISDWSSDVCSSDLHHFLDTRSFKLRMDERKETRFDHAPETAAAHPDEPAVRLVRKRVRPVRQHRSPPPRDAPEIGSASCRARVLSGGVDLGGRRNIKKQKLKVRVVRRARKK